MRGREYCQEHQEHSNQGTQTHEQRLRAVPISGGAIAACCITLPRHLSVLGALEGFAENRCNALASRLFFRLRLFRESLRVLRFYRLDCLFFWFDSVLILRATFHAILLLS